MACIYILFSDSIKKFYTGSTREENAIPRLDDHNSGKSKSTKNARPWRIIYEEKSDSYRDARKREIFLKSGAGREWVREKFGYLKT